MNSGYSLLLIIPVIFVGWILYQIVRVHPELFKAETLQRASFSCAILAIFLMAVIGFFVVTM